LARLVVRLSRLALAGLAVAVAGVILGLLAHHYDAQGLMPYSRGVVGLGVLLYVVGRWRTLALTRKPPR